MKKMWLSPCPEHKIPDENCKLCALGHWKSTWKVRMNSIVFAISPNYWRWRSVRKIRRRQLRERRQNEKSKNS